MNIYHDESTGTINYSTGDVTLIGSGVPFSNIHLNTNAGGLFTNGFMYYPNLPVLGLEDFITSSNQFPGSIAFDTTYAYNIKTQAPLCLIGVRKRAF